MMTPHRRARFRVRNITKILDEWAWWRCCTTYKKFNDGIYRQTFFKMCQRYLQ